MMKEMESTFEILTICAFTMQSAGLAWRRSRVQAPDRTNTQDRKILRRMCCLCFDNGSFRVRTISRMPRLPFSSLKWLTETLKNQRTSPKEQGTQLPVLHSGHVIVYTDFHLNQFSFQLVFYRHGFMQDHFHIDFHLSLKKACLRNFINFLKWRE